MDAFNDAPHSDGNVQQELQDVCQLAASLCGAPSPAEALTLAAALLSSKLPGTCHVSLALLSQDAQQLRYHKLCGVDGRADAAAVGPGGIGGGGLGSRPTDNTAAGLATELKEMVRIGDIHDGDLGLQDWQHLAKEHNARAFVAVPLIVAQKALGAFVMASMQAHAFDGRERFIQTVSSLTAPYTGLLRCSQELQAVESFVRQMLPPRVATALQHQQHGQQPPSAGPSSSLQHMHMARVFAFAHGAMTGAPAPHSHGPQPMSRSSSSRSASSSGSDSQLPSCAILPVHMGQLLAFQQPRAEMAYRVAAQQRWQSYLDVALLCLTLLSVVGPALHAHSSGSRLLDALGLLLVQALALCAWHHKHTHKLHVYVAMREPVLAVQRLVRVLAYIVELQLAQHPHAMAPAALGLAVLLWHGTVAHVRFRMHVPLQAMCSVAVTLATVEHTVRRRPPGCDKDMLWRLACTVALQLLLGFGLPTMLVYIVERHTRLAFLRGLK